MKLRDLLQLPEGWNAETFQGTTTLEPPHGPATGYPHPYNPQPIEWHLAAAWKEVEKWEKKNMQPQHRNPRPKA